MKHIKFPRDFKEYHFPESVDINIKQINKWIQDCLEIMNKTEERFVSISSGNTKVFVSKYKGHNGGDCFSVDVARDYWFFDNKFELK